MDKELWQLVIISIVIIVLGEIATSISEAVENIKKSEVIQLLQLLLKALQQS